MLPAGVEVKSVDGFQGREKELILFSAVRAGRGGALGFVADARRLNVLLTRARRGLIVVAEARTLTYSEHWANWLAWVASTGSVCAPPGWAPPPRPSRRRERSDDHDERYDEHGRRIRSRSRSRSRERAAVTKPLSRAEKREQRRAARAAAAAAGGESEEEQWRRSLLGGAEAAEMQSSSERLLPNWHACEDGDGRTYFHNSASLQVCWEPSRQSSRLDSTRLDSTRLDSTRLDSTRLGSTRLDSTQTRLDATRTRLGLDSTRLKLTGLDLT